MSASPEGAAVVLIPGLLCDASVWEPQRAALSAGRAVLIPDLWGLDSIEAMAERVLASAPGRFALAGHSMGARVALALLDRAPERVERLALLDTGVHPRRPGEAEKRQELVDLAHREGMAALAARWLPPMVHPARAQDPALMGPLTAMVCRATPAIFAGQVRALLNRPDAAAVLPRIACPTLVACGRQDGWSPLEQHEAMAAAIPGARLSVIEESGHMCTVEAPEAVTDLLHGWLRPGFAA
ncbi:alpha/beta hydrolase [Roseomonas sp. OT10]|uniref:alpha/beta fold hydrolase n=1 Tax=Roseomonas cutis TaxID=2897332 RepID=UPI001E58A7DD|nr:alpha/beta fold hydrolase [Roseomonas sp. OT10]UFN47189.1 alpha/beta hydrolase [Roseomonas sp. OT10]